MDRLFCINTISATSNPQTIVYAALHQDYSGDYIWDSRDKWPSEQECGEIAVKRLLAGDRGHWGPFEHPQIVLACGYVNHGTVQQLTRHRVGVSFDVQSFRYTGSQVIEVAEGKRDPEELFYLRPAGEYFDRQGKRYEYTAEERDDDLDTCIQASETYALRVSYGMSEEHARDLLPFCYRQHFVLSCNARALCHLLDMRWKKDAQQEIQWFSGLLFERFNEWMPEIAAYYKQHRSGRARLAP